MIKDPVIDWLLDGDVSIQYEVSRDIIRSKGSVLSELQKKIPMQGWGSRFLSKQKSNGHWGITFYQPKWTSTHYTLLDLKIIGLPSENKQAKKSALMVLDQPVGSNGGINLAVSLSTSDVCVNGMILNYCSYFLPRHCRLKEIVDFLLDVQMKDGGWNCQYLNPNTKHSSLHSTISVLEGLLQFRRSTGKYRIDEIHNAEKEAIEFLLKHNLYQSHRTGKTIDARFLRLSFPFRWRYDILRCLDYLRDANIPYEPRIQSALEIIIKKKNNNGKWPLQEKHKGAVHFDMEKVGKLSRWNTLRALRVVHHFKKPEGIN